MIALTAGDRRELKRWMLCGALVLCAHAGIAAALVEWRAPIDDGEIGTDAIEVDFAPLRVQSDPAPDNPAEKSADAQIEPLPEQQSEAMLPAKPPDPLPEPRPADDNPPALVTTIPQTARARATAATWKSEIVRLLKRNKRYPAAARDRGEEGVAELAFSIDPQGRLLSSRIVRSSGSSALDDETLALVQRTQPFPAPPPALAGTEMTVPVQFNIR